MARNPSAWRDLALAAAVAVGIGVAAARFDLHETLFSWSRRWESLQIDELPVALFVFALCLVVLYARRLAQLRKLLRQNRELAQQTLDAQEAERKHLARELHDELGQYLNAIKLDLQAIPAVQPEQPASSAARRIAGNADHVYAAVGAMIRRLRPAALDELGLAAALEACVDRWRLTQPALVIRLMVEADLQDLGESTNLAIYRIVQEALTNCARHAAATWVSVQLRREKEGGVLLLIQDDGRGLPAQTQRGGHGLAGMRERVELLGGEFDLLSAQDGGVTIRITLPAARDDA